MRIKDQNSKKIVFSGGTHAGKTTLVEHYFSLGYPIIPEAGMTFIGEMIEKMGFETYKAWRGEHQQEFFNRLVERQIELESSLSNERTFSFFDRSMIDTIAMCKHVGVQVPAQAEERARSYRYDDVFICDLLPHFSDRAQTGRVFTKSDSENIARLVHETYVEYGYAPVHLPPVSIKERIKLISKKIDLLI